MWKPGHWFTPETFKVELLQMKGWLGGEAGGGFKVRQLSQWTAAVQIWQRIHVTLNYWLLFFFVFFLALKAFLLRNISSFFFLSPTLMAQSAWKKLQPQIIHCNLPFEDPNASNWAFMTYKLYLPLFLFFISFPSGVCFSSFPPCCGVTLSLSLSGCSLVSLQCTFSLSPSPPPPPPPDNELLTEYIIGAVVLFVVVLASKKKRWIINDHRHKKKKEQNKSLIYIYIYIF